jgi:hypothetical protein
MRIPSRLTFIIALFILMCAGSALAAPSAMSYQGQLRSSTGTPVADGMYSVTFTLWTDSVAGSMIWTETQSVQVTGGEGLFSCQLGNLQPLGGPIVVHSSEQLYLQTAIEGQPLLPRQQLSASPYAHYSGSIMSDVDGAGSMELRVGDDTTKILATHESFTNLLDSYVHIEDDGVHQSLRCFPAGQPQAQSCVADHVTGHDAIRQLYVDEDADGIAEGQGVMSVTGGAFGSVVYRGTWDSNDNGVEDFSVGGEVNDTSSQWGATQTRESVGGGNHRDGWNVLCVDGRVRTELKEEFQNGDIPNQEDFVDSRGAFSKAINTKGTGATVRVAMEATDSASTILESDSDGDGIAEARGIVTTKPASTGGTSQGRFTSDADEDGEDECLAEAAVSDKFAQVRGFKVEISGASRSSFGSYSDSAGTVTSIERDSDGDGLEDFSVAGAVNDSSAQWGVSHVSGVVGASQMDGWNVECSSIKVRTDLKLEFQNGDIPTQEDFVDSRGAFSKAINTKGTGATVRVATGASDSASTVLESDSDGDGKVDSRANIAAVLNGNVVIGCMRDADDDGTADISATTEVSNDSATFSLHAMPPGLPISSAITMGAGSLGVHMEVGAATCDGTNWTNASDRNLKENFKAVDGEELLSRVSELPITEWNYKGDADNRHIGPTAQDFKSTFGVGSDGKSISTIDPSGVALAAIQQLIRENEELRARVAKLEAESAKQAR